MNGVKAQRVADQIAVMIEKAIKTKHDRTQVSDTSNTDLVSFVDTNRLMLLLMEKD